MVTATSPRPELMTAAPEWRGPANGAPQLSHEVGESGGFERRLTSDRIHGQLTGVVGLQAPPASAATSVARSTASRAAAWPRRTSITTSSDGDMSGWSRDSTARICSRSPVAVTVMRGLVVGTGQV